MGRAVAKGIVVASGIREGIGSLGARTGITAFLALSAVELALAASAVSSGKIPAVVLSILRALLAI